MSDTTTHTSVVTESDDATEPDSLTEKINEGHRRVTAATRRSEEANKDAVFAAIETGELLIEKKKQVSHGNWTAWLEDEFVGSARTAELYMQIAAHKEESQPIADLGIAGVQRKLNALPKGEAAQTARDEESEPTPTVTPDHLAELCSSLVRKAIPGMAAEVADRAVALAEPDDHEKVASQRAAMVREAQAYLDRISAEPPSDLTEWGYDNAAEDEAVA